MPTTQEWERIRVISDGELYERAVAFVAATDAVENKQVNSLLEYSRSIYDLLAFVQHQRDRKWNEWEANMGQFYESLFSALFAIVRDVQDSWGFVTNSQNKVEAQKRTAIFATLLTREFIQHLVAEMLYARRPKS